MPFDSPGVVGPDRMDRAAVQGARNVQLPGQDADVAGADTAAQCLCAPLGGRIRCLVPTALPAASAGAVVIGNTNVTEVAVDWSDRLRVRWLLAALLVPCAMAQTPEADERRREQWRQQEEQQQIGRAHV